MLDVTDASVRATNLGAVTTTPRPGWYPDPADDRGPGYRWWDGSGWTDDVADHAYAPSPGETATPVPARRRSRTVQVVAWTVVVALVLSTAAGALLLLWSGPASPTPPADVENGSAVGGQLDELARRATIGRVTMDLPGTPYKVSGGTHQVAGVLDTVFLAEATVHRRTAQHSGWTAMVCLASVDHRFADDFDLDRDSAATIRRLAEEIYGTGPTEVKDLDVAEHAVDGHGGVRISARVHYRIEGLPSRYDDLTAILVRLDDGSVVAALSSVPNDASAEVRDLAAESLGSLTIS